MKKLLSVLAAVGLTATASTAVVACTTSDVKAKKLDVTYGPDKDGDKVFTVKTKKSIDVKLVNKASAEVDKDKDAEALFADYHLFGKDEIDLGSIDENGDYIQITAASKIKKDAKSAKINVQFVIDADTAKAIGLLKDDGKTADSNVTITVGTAKKKSSSDETLVLDKKVVKVELQASKFADLLK